MTKNFIAVKYNSTTSAMLPVEILNILFTALIWHRAAAISFLLQRLALAATNFQVMMNSRQL